MLFSGAIPQAQHAQQGVSNLPQQGSNSSRGYASQDSRATEYAVADTLTAGNSTSNATSALPAQQDSLVSKVVGKLIPSALASKQADEPDGPDGAEGHKGTYYGGVLDAAGNQTMNDSTGRSRVQDPQCIVLTPAHALYKAQHAQQLQMTCTVWCCLNHALHAVPAAVHV